MYDWLGTPIELGSELIYPNRQGSALWMVRARVLQILDDSIQVQVLSDSFRNRSSKITKLTRIDRVTVIKQPLMRLLAA